MVSIVPHGSNGAGGRESGGGVARSRTSPRWTGPCRRGSRERGLVGSLGPVVGSPIILIYRCPLNASSRINLESLHFRQAGIVALVCECRNGAQRGQGTGLLNCEH